MAPAGQAHERQTSHDLPMTTAAQLGLECVEPLLPELAERRQPGVHLRQGCRVDRVEAAPAVGADRGEAALAQHLELHGHRRLPDPELPRDHLDHVAGRLLAAGQQLEDPAPDRVAEDVEGVHSGTTLPTYADTHRPADARAQSGSAPSVHGGLTPGRARAAEEVVEGRQLVGRGPVGGGVGQVEGQSHHRGLPADAHGAGTELLPVVGRAGQQVVQLEQGAALVGRSEGHDDPTHVTSELPGRGEGPGRVAGRDLAAGVAFDLVAPAELQVAADGSEPALDAVGLGQGGPDLVRAGGVLPGQAQVGPGHGAGGCGELGSYINVH